MQHTKTHWRAVLAGATALLLVGAGCGSGGTTAPAGDTGTPVGDTSQPAAAAQTVTLAGAKAKTKYFDTEADVEVLSVTLNYANDKAIAPSEGNMYVRVEMVVTNTGAKPFSVATVNYRLNTSKEVRDYAYVIDTQVVSDLLTDRDLKSGEAATGAIYYEVDAGETVDTMGLVYEGSEQTAIPFKK